MQNETEQKVLDWLVSPISGQTFRREFLEKKWLVAGAPDAARFATLVSLADLDRVVGEFGLRIPDIRLVKHEAEVEARQYVYGDSLIDPIRVGRLFAEGATVIFAALQNRHEPVRRLCSAVAREMTLKTQANIYLTPPHSQGFDIHWDTHDVFVLQIEGTKHWRIYDGGPEHPLGGQKFDPKVHSPGPMVDEFTLRAGQVLYIPRGVMHAAAATDDVSLHITLGVMCYTWSELLADCLTELVERSPAWRENLPVGFGNEPGGVEAIRAELAQRLAGFVAEMNVAEVLSERIEQAQGAHRPRAGDHLRQAMAAKTLSDGSRVGVRAGVSSSVERAGDRIVVRSGAREIAFPAAAERTLRRVLSGEPVSVAAIDDDLDPTSRRTVISALIREGIVAASDNGHQLEVTHAK